VQKTGKCPVETPSRKSGCEHDRKKIVGAMEVLARNTHLAPRYAFRVTASVGATTLNAP